MHVENSFFTFVIMGVIVIVEMIRIKNYDIIENFRNIFVCDYVTNYLYKEVINSQLNASIHSLQCSRSLHPKEFCVPIP